VLIFVNTRADTTDMAEALSKDGFAAMPLSGELVQAQRTRTLAAFRSGSVKVLVATDVAARGLDIPDVGLVIQAATPMDSEIYIHRSGRTGRAGQKGRCVLLVPARRERRLKRMLNDAGVDSNWCDIPTKVQVEKALSKRSRKRLFDAIDDEAELPEEDLAYAGKLAAERDPVRVIATLLRLAKPEMRCDAREIEPAQSFTRGWKHRERERMQDTRSAPANRGPRERSGGGSDFVRFNVTWGFRDGANPQRLLAMVCRRGDITGRMVGSIDLGPTESSFEVRASEAEHFAKRAGQTDPREPNLQIARGGGQVQRGGQGGGGRDHQAGGGGGYQGNGYQGRGGAGYRGRDGYQGGGDGGYRGRDNNQGGGYRGARPEQERSRSYGNSGGGGYRGQGQSYGGGQQGGGYDRSGGNSGGYNQSYGRGRDSGGYRGGEGRSGGYQGQQERSYGGGGGGYRGREDSARGGYQNRGYEPRQASSDSRGYGGPRNDRDAGPGAPKRGFQKRGQGQESRPYGRSSGYQRDSGDHSSGGGYQGRR